MIGQSLKILTMLQRVKVAAVRGQQENIVETSIKRMKKFWRSVWPQNEGLPTLSICDLQLLIQITINEVNRTPLEEGSTLTPGDFIKATKALPTMLDLGNIDNKQIEKDLKKIREYYQVLTDKMIRFKVGGDRLWKRAHTKRGQRTEIKKVI